MIMKLTNDFDNILYDYDLIIYIINIFQYIFLAAMTITQS